MSSKSHPGDGTRGQGTKGGDISVVSHPFSRSAWLVYLEKLSQTPSVVQGIIGGDNKSLPAS